MICTLTARRLKPGAYDAFRSAWDPGRVPNGWTHIYHRRDVEDPCAGATSGPFGSIASPSQRRAIRAEGRQPSSIR